MKLLGPILSALAIIILASCAPEHVEVCETASKPGFWLGLWHGTIVPVTFFISLFNDSVEIYASSNNGGWYNFGFVLGVGGLTFGSSKSTS